MNLSVTVLDFLIVLVIVVSAGYAAWRGFLSETLTILAWVSAAFGCLYFGPYLVPLLRSLVSQPWLASLLAYAAAFLAVFIPLAFMSHRMSQSVKNSPIGPLDRALGIAFGVVRGLVIVGLGYLAFTYFVPIRQQPHWVTEARLLPMLQSSGEILLSLVPDRDHENFNSAAASPPPERSSDPLADMIRQNDAVSPQNPPPAEPVPHAASHARAASQKSDKAYGAGDRRALDRLIEATGNGGNGKP